MTPRSLFPFVSAFPRPRVFALLLLAAVSRAAAQSSVDTPAREFDFEHMRLELTFTRADIADKQMRGVVTYWVNTGPWVAQAEKAGGLKVPATINMSLNAVGLKIQKVEVAALVDGHGLEPAAKAAGGRGAALQKAAEGAAWRTAVHEYKGGVLRFDLGNDFGAAGRDVLVRVQYTVKNPKEGLYFVMPDADHPGRPPMIYSMSEPLMGRHWLPCHDWPDTRWTSDIFITAPKPLSGVSIGRPVGEPVRAAVSPELKELVKPDEELWTCHWRQDEPTDPHMLGFAVSEFVELKIGEWKGRPVVAYVQPGDEETGRYTFRRVPEMLAFYSKTIGMDFPFAQYGHVGVIGHFHGGMEHIGFSMLAPSMFTAGDRGDVLESISQYNYIAHMLGHEWFGGVVNYRQIKHAWLNEAFATYLHQRWRSQTHSWDAFDEDMGNTARRIAATDRGGRGRPLVRDDLDDAEEVYSYDGGSVYWKGAWVLHMLRRELGGDEPFWKAVRAYLEKNRWTGVETEDFRKALEEATGKDLKPFFDQWVYRGGTPELKVTYQWDAEGKKAVVEIKQTQKIDEKHPPFQFPLQLWFDAQGAPDQWRVPVTGAAQKIELPFNAPPTVFCVDPNGDLLKSLQEEKPVAMWIAQVRKGPTALSRSLAIDHLRRERDAAFFTALREALLDSKEFAGTRQRAARALLRWRTAGAVADAEEESAEKEANEAAGDDAVARTNGQPPLAAQPNAAAVLEALLSAERAGVDSPGLLATLVELLGRFTDSREAYAAVLRRAGNQEHIAVQAAALKALDDFKPEVRTDALVAALARAACPGVSLHVRGDAIEALKKLNDPRALEVLLPALKAKPKEALNMVERMNDLLTKLADKDAARCAGVSEVLVLQLTDPRPTIRAAALQGLKAVGDVAVLPKLREIAEKDDTPKVRKAAEAAVEAIEKRKS